MFEPKPEIDQVALAHVDRVMQGAIEQFKAEQAPEGYRSPEPAPATTTAAAPAGPREPPQEMVDAVVDPDTGHLHFEAFGLLFGIPAHDAQPDLVKAWRADTARDGAWLSGLGERAAGIALLVSAEDRKVAAIEVIREVDRFAGPAEAAARKHHSSLLARPGSDQQEKAPFLGRCASSSITAVGALTRG